MYEFHANDSGTNTEFSLRETSSMADAYRELKSGKPGKNADYILPDSDSRYLSGQDLAGMSKSQCGSHGRYAERV